MGARAIGQCVHLLCLRVDLAQVQNDVSLPCTEATEDKDEAAIAVERAAWMTRARNFVSAIAGSATDNARKKVAQR